jgi:hypothetical protein
MSYLRYGIVLLTLLILSDSFSLVFAQSMWDFKGKSTNISPLYPNNPNKISKKPSVISGDYQNIKSPSKIRFRYLSGTYTSDSQEAASSTSSIIWDGVGIGQTVFKRKMSISGKTVELENTSMDISYTYGDEYTLTLGSSSVSSGELIVITSDSEIYTSSTVFGYGYFSILGIEFGIFEILLGYKYIRYAFTGLESNTTTTSLYMSSFDDSGSQYLTGIGLVF